MLTPQLHSQGPWGGQRGASLESGSSRESQRFGDCTVSFTGSEAEQVAQGPEGR